jgi:hypothetical protein
VLAEALIHDLGGLVHLGQALVAPLDRGLPCLIPADAPDLVAATQQL